MILKYSGLQLFNFECPNSDYLTIKHFISSNINNTGHLTFNKTCCEEKGVPVDCMGLCRLDTTLRSAVPPDACDKWENTSKECVIEGEVDLEIDYA